jgi:K+-transporting ATPase ATPase B chain
MVNKYNRYYIKNPFHPYMIWNSIMASFLKLNPIHQFRKPVLFTVYVGSLLTTGLFIDALIGNGEESAKFIFAITLWFWLTLFFANFAEALAEARGKTQAESLRKARREIQVKKISAPVPNAKIKLVRSADLRINDYILVTAGDYIPCDGEVIEGIASLNESAITGESAPVIRESGGDRNTVTGGTRVISDALIIKITANPGETFLDHMIGLVEGAKRQKTPNEVSLSTFLVAMTIIFLVVCATLVPYSIYSVKSIGTGAVVSLPTLIALFVCLAPTTISGLISAIGIAGMDRMIKRNVIAVSGGAIEAAGDVNVLLLDKTGTITLGNRQATDFIPARGISAESLADAAQLSSLTDETSEGRSIVVLAKEKYGIRARNLQELEATFIPFTPQTRMSGVNLKECKIRKGAPDAVLAYVKQLGGELPSGVQESINIISRQGATPLIVAMDAKILGVICLKDIVKGGIRERFTKLRKMGVKTIMITGDNPLTAASIAAEAGVDDFLAQATPEDKLNLINQLQAEGRLVAMAGDGTNDAPALAQADVAVAMNTGTQIAKEAGNMIDLDSNPTKLIDIVEIGKQLLMTRGSITTFSIANDIAKYFAILPAAFSGTYPFLNSLNIMHLTTPKTAILSAVIFNALMIVFLIPLALHGVKYRAVSATQLLRTNILIYGVGGIIAPFLGIKIIDYCLQSLQGIYFL